MLKKFTSTAMAAVVAIGLGIAATAQPAEARGGRTAGLIGLGVLGAVAIGAAAANARGRDGCYRVAGECSWREGRCYINRYGEEVCRRGYRVCAPSRLVCD
jgi:hypothetical protein